MNPKVFGWNYPAGVTEKTIHEHFGSEPEVPLCKMCEKNPADETLDGVGICQKCLANMEA